jgi:phage gp45-like
MHRATPLMTSFRAFVSGGARSIVDKVDDTRLMQEMAGNFMKGETRDAVEAPQNYGFTSVVQAATKGLDGQIQECAEAFISFMGGNRSFPVCSIMDDRRFRPMGLQPGENAQYDDNGQMTLMRRAGLFLLSLDSADQTGKMVQRMASLRHVNKQKQQRQKPTPQPGAPGQGGGGGGGGTVDTRDAQQTDPNDQIRQSHAQYKHEGESVNTEVRCTKDRIEFRAGDSVVGYYESSSQTWFLQGKIVTMQGTSRVEAVGPTYTGLDTKGEGAAKQHWAKV